jgi:regulatory protein
LIFPYELFLKNTLFVDDELTVEQKKNLEEKIELYKIKQSSFVYLSGRNHSKYELKLKLLKKSYNKQLVSVVLSDLERLNYLDDKEFAKQYFEVKLKKKKGINLIKSELAKKGVRREIVEEVSLSFSNDPRLIESAKILSEKKLQVLNRKNQTELQKKQKMFQYLLSRGFSTEIIKESIEKLKLD